MNEFLGLSDAQWDKYLGMMVVILGLILGVLPEFIDLRNDATKKRTMAGWCHLAIFLVVLTAYFAQDKVHDQVVAAEKTEAKLEADKAVQKSEDLRKMSDEEAKNRQRQLLADNSDLRAKVDAGTKEVENLKKQADVHTSNLTAKLDLADKKADLLKTSNDTLNTQLQSALNAIGEQTRQIAIQQNTIEAMRKGVQTLATPYSLYIAKVTLPAGITPLWKVPAGVEPSREDERSTMFFSAGGDRYLGVNCGKQCYWTHAGGSSWLIARRVDGRDVSFPGFGFSIYINGTSITEPYKLLVNGVPRDDNVLVSYPQESIPEYTIARAN